jgi:hypothetical protein
MTINLNNFTSITSGLFVNIPNLGTGGSAAFSDRQSNITFGGVQYVGLGRLVSIGASDSELKTTGGQLTIGIGTHLGTYSDIVNNVSLKGSKITVLPIRLRNSGLKKSRNLDLIVECISSFFSS